MSAERIAELLAKARKDAHSQFGPSSVDMIELVSLYQAELTRLRAELDTAHRERDEMRERCAQVADRHAKELDNDWNRRQGSAEYMVEVATDIAEDIRALSPPTVTEEKKS